MSRVPMTQAVAADYADAMLVARRAKNAAVSILMLVLLIQLAVFVLVRLRPQLLPAPSIDSVASTQPAAQSDSNRVLAAVPIDYIVSGSVFLGVVMSLALPALLLLIVMIMLVGRLVGVTHVTRAFCWSVVLIVLLFPWQALLNSKVYAATRAGDQTVTANASEPADMKVPGVLYTFSELRRESNFSSTPWQSAWLHWCRFVGFPVIAVLMVMSIQMRSRRGLRFALGEADVPVDVETR